MNCNKYDIVIIGAGLFGATCAHELSRTGLKCLVVDKRSHIGGNCYTEGRDGINLHCYGAHIFHTNNRTIWTWINQFTKFNCYHHKVKVNYRGNSYSFPPNLATFRQLWNVHTSEEARAYVERMRVNNGVQDNLENYAINEFGSELYNIFIRGYTQKQWGRAPYLLPSSILRRIPLRFNEDDSYFDDEYQGIPVGGYTPIFEKMLTGIDIMLNVDYFDNRKELDSLAGLLLYTGPIDKFFDFRYGRLAYRSLRFESQKIDTRAFQNTAIVNYTDAEIPYTRIIEHKHFEFGQQPVTWITKEFPCAYVDSCDPYYPVKDSESQIILSKYRFLLSQPCFRHCYIGGRLGEYQYYDMHQVIAAALRMAARIRKDAYE